ncbi:hypothetical protein H1235_07770 [Pseudoxanthomonas sp. NC8]|nr:hypothetical protein H1235_07770 [Pseudoxanthomonas sp. NC8]
MSPSATVASNHRIAEADPAGRHSLRYRTFALWDQQQQMSHLFAYWNGCTGSARARWWC